jgi:release factor glutamine methyltransferase
MNFQEWYKRSQDQAKFYNISLAELDWLVIGVTNCDRLNLKLGQLKFEPSQILELDWLWQQRLEAKTPIQHLIGKTYWRDLELVVSSAVLIPRPETEILVDLALGMHDPNLSSIWVDLGTGSGAIAFGLAQLLPKATIYAIDISVAAMAIATAISQKLNLDNRINFQQGCWWSPLKQLQGKISAMVSNPPYIPTAMIAQLQPEVTLHEPHLALDGGENGLQCIQYLVETASDYLRSGGIWLTEIMAGQGQQVVQMLKKQGNYAHIQIYNDLADLDRFVLAYRK